MTMIRDHIDIFEAKVFEIGPLVKEFIEAGILVFFGRDAPPELVEFSIIHDGNLADQDVQQGDAFIINEQEFKVLAVGEVANTNFRNLGHIILKFNGRNVPELPGDICVESKPLPEIKVGNSIRISRKLLKEDIC